MISRGEVPVLAFIVRKKQVLLQKQLTPFQTVSNALILSVRVFSLFEIKIWPKREVIFCKEYRLNILG